MKIENHVYTISLSIEEVSLVLEALKTHCKALQENINNGTPETSLADVKLLRNDFGRICGVTFMGKDA